MRPFTSASAVAAKAANLPGIAPGCPRERHDPAADIRRFAPARYRRGCRSGWADDDTRPRVSRRPRRDPARRGRRAGRGQPGDLLVAAQPGDPDPARPRTAAGPARLYLADGPGVPRRRGAVPLRPAA